MGEGGDWNRIVIQTEGYTIFISHFELQGIGSPFLDPIGVGEVVGIQSRQQLRICNT